jgi:hypothetical protein
VFAAAAALSMSRTTIAGAAFVTASVIVALIRLSRPERDVERPAAPPLAPATQIRPDLLYGRVTIIGGDTYEGRLRWGGDEEAFWGDYFNGTQDKNPWTVHFPKTPSPFEIFGFEIGGSNQSIDLRRLFMARFGDLARIEAHVGDVQVRLKSGTTFELDRFAAGDIDDGVRVWDGKRGVTDLDARQIRTIEFLPTPPLVGIPERLHGTVRTNQGSFTGFILWDQQDCMGPDELEGGTAGGKVRLRYDTVRSIARHSRDSALVTLLDGREMLLSGTRAVGDGNRGIYVDDPRYGRRPPGRGLQHSVRPDHIDRAPRPRRTRRPSRHRDPC